MTWSEVISSLLELLSRFHLSHRLFFFSFSIDLILLVSWSFLMDFFLELPRILNLNLNLFRVVMWSVSRSFFVMRDVSLFLIRSFVLLLFLLHDLWSPYVPSLTTSRLRIESRAPSLRWRRPKREGSRTRPAPYCSLVMAELFARSLAPPPSTWPLLGGPPQVGIDFLLAQFVRSPSFSRSSPSSLAMSLVGFCSKFVVRVSRAWGKNLVSSQLNHCVESRHWNLVS